MYALICEIQQKTKSDNSQEKYGMFEVNKPKNSHHKEENLFFFSIYKEWQMLTKFTEVFHIICKSNHMLYRCKLT